jgi:acetolactate synthase-1/3 small subunit
LSGRKQRHVLGILVEDHPGVLTKMSGMFSRRGFNIDTIVAGKTKIKGITRVVISLRGDNRTLEQIQKQINKLIDTIKIEGLQPEYSVFREHCLVKVENNETSRADLVNLATLYKANVLDISSESMILEVVGRPEKVDNFLDLMKKYHIKEICRTGVNAMQRGRNGRSR